MIAWLVTAGPGLQSRLGNALLVGSLLVPLIAFGAMAAAILRGLLRIVYAQMLDGLMRPALHSAVLVVIIFFGITLTPAKALGGGGFWLLPSLSP
ncbi:hypothetical protein LJB71_07270 [Thermomonas sp. S9]|uniref:hypothetical protein n=1 Tax=Thermomonas sp. S9 TaxID=2885203 RepID=UPI00216B049C|nr:hypothetical protein [Thermomonas sp. S9]MCR6496038.1 hypothetical protein [Thermomonas sp. S9]